MIKKGMAEELHLKLKHYDEYLGNKQWLTGDDVSFTKKPFFTRQWFVVVYGQSPE